MIKKGFVIIMIVLLLAVPLVLAKGSSSYSNTNPVSVRCEEKSTLQERLKCRLEQSSSADIPEACLNLDNQADCVSFYQRAGYCYDVSAEEKDICFRKESGYESDPSLKKFYISALLYELQKYVEDDYDNKKISSVEASKLIADIITLKRQVLSGMPFSIIQGKLFDYTKARGLR